MTPRIERGVPCPGDYHRTYPWRQMQIGDSFFIEKPSKVVSAAACCFASRHSGYRFVTRKVRENGRSGTRCWRVSMTPILTVVRTAAQESA
jgi:hypothetical protein